MTIPLPLSARDILKLREASDRLHEARRSLPVRDDVVGVVLLRGLISECCDLACSILGDEAAPPVEDEDGDGPFGLPDASPGYTLDYTSHPKVEPYRDDREDCGWHTITDGRWECG